MIQRHFTFVLKRFRAKRNYFFFDKQLKGALSRYLASL